MNKGSSYGSAVRSAYGQVFELANLFECSLNGKAARLDVSKRSGLAEVTAKDGSDRAVFNWPVAMKVMKEKCGRFVSRDNLDGRQDFQNPVLSTLAILRG